MNHHSLSLDPQACTSCLICARECPAWAITIHSHPEASGEPGGRKVRQAAVLDDFCIDFGTCLYCGICVEECPFDALAWSDVPVPAGDDAAGLVLDLDALASRR